MSQAPREPALGSRGGIWGRVTGTDRRERIRAERYKPYSYQSNSKTLVYLGAALGIWVLLALLLAWNDRTNVSLYEDWQSRGLTVIPPTGIEPDGLLDYATAEGINCTSLAEIGALTPDCVRVFDIRKEFVDSQDKSNLLFAGMVLATVGVAFAFSTFTHRASRNLLALKSAGQRHTPEWAVLWFFIPVMNAVRPVQVFREMFKASDPLVSGDDDEEWKRKGRTHPALYAWWPLFVVSLFFNPIFVPRVWKNTREDISDLIATSDMLFWADVVMATMGVAAFLMATQLHRLQEVRHQKVGDIVVTPRMPGDPFGEGLATVGQDPAEPGEGKSR